MRLTDSITTIVARRRMIRARHCHKWITSKVSIGKRQCVNRRAAAARWETIANVVHRHTEGADAPVHRFDRGTISANAKVGAAKLEWLSKIRARDRPTLAATADIDPVVQSPDWIVNATFENTNIKSGKQRLPFIRHSIAVAIRKEHDVRSTGDNDSTPRRHYTITRWQIIRPHVRFVP